MLQDADLFTNRNVSRLAVSPCFQHTTLVAVPCLFTLIISPILLIKLFLHATDKASVQQTPIIISKIVTELLFEIKSDIYLFRRLIC
jgi:hypothetical protein